ncbi:MAG: polysaccharide deacetylase family protein [Christensenellaceae bacterium]|jgi:polysaccharide deacetylase family sporulation protein PdaB|nr:polysaccharide deacetylase family protein [Christensenellaceae bacterium]
MHFHVLKSNNLKLIAVMIVVIALLSVNFGGKTLASAYFGQERKIPVYSVQTDEKKIAISFDAAWGADKTEKIMDILDRHNVTATFFLVGFWVDKYPEMVELIDARGFEIGTHSNTHPDLVKLDSNQIFLELKTSMEKITARTNKPVKLFRAPFGSYSNQVLTEAEKLGLITIQWDVDSLDWQGIDGNRITSNIITKVKNGSIILCHNNSDHILEALDGVIGALKGRGYQFVSIGELIYTQNYSINSQGVQIQN